jgi:hypothetical protein
MSVHMGCGNWRWIHNLDMHGLGLIWLKLLYITIAMIVETLSTGYLLELWHTCLVVAHACVSQLPPIVQME